MLTGPVFRAELLRLARRRHYYALRVAYGLVLLLLVWVGYRPLSWNSAEASRADLALFASKTFHRFAVVQWVTVLLLVPAVYGGAIADEKQRRTLPYLMASRLSGGEIILDKVLGRSAHLAVFVAIGLPVVSLLGLFGGISAESVVAAYVGIFSSAAFAIAMTVLISTRARRVRDAILSAYLLMMAWLLVPPLIFLFGTVFRPATYYWLRPVNDWLDASSPFGLGIRAYFWLPLGMSTPAMVDRFLWMVGLQLGGAALMILLAAWRLRPIFRRQEDAPGRQSWSDRRRSLRPPYPYCGDDPVFWKERHFVPSDRFTRALLPTATVLVTVPLALMTWERDGYRVIPTFWRSGYRGLLSIANAPEGFLEALQVDLGWSVAFWLIGVAGASASCMAIEREKGTWVSLTATPLTGREILRGKLLGVLWNHRGFALVPLLIWAVGLVTLTVQPLGILLSIAMVALLTWFVATVGVYCSLRASNTSRAMGSTLAVLAFFTGYPILLPFWFMRVLDADPLTILGVLPSIPAWSMIPPGRFTRWWSFTTDGMPPTILLWIVGGFGLAGVCVYAGTALALSRRIIDQLDGSPLSRASHPRAG
jgi:ABC-type transport system involved in multi-copper enzyme maturation permease subunit